MAEPFKHRIGPDAVAALAERLAAAAPGFDRARFEREALEGLEALELKARVDHVAAALRPRLPAAWSTALDVVLASLPEAPKGTEDLTSGFAMWPLLRLVAVHGLDEPERSLDALAELTSRFSAEFAVRPFLVHHPELAWPRVHRWAESRDVHVRRLASEGTRPRLPWGLQLRASVADPSRGLEVLERLVDDPEPYVRRSVANHLNDVSRDHPERALAVARRWAEGPGSGRAWVVRHGLRTLLKQGVPEALAILGYGPPEVQLVVLEARPGRVRIGDVVELVATLETVQAQRWMVDWVVQAPRADGGRGARVVKGRTLEVVPGRVVVRHRLSLKPVTTRVTRPGPWWVAVQVNGHRLGEVGFDVGGDAR